MKTINKDIEIFNTEISASSFFKTIKSGHILHAPREKAYFVDQSKTALEAWPNKYILMDEK
jgi:hypothetical protein